MYLDVQLKSLQLDGFREISFRRLNMIPKHLMVSAVFFRHLFQVVLYINSAFFATVAYKYSNSCISIVFY